MHATIELRDLEIAADIGSYGRDDVVPDAHLIDMTLTIDPSLVWIDQDGLDRVFDYDPLIRDIQRLACDGHYETQERLMSRIVSACATYPQIKAISIALRKTPVVGSSSSLGVRLEVDAPRLSQMREGNAAA